MADIRMSRARGSRIWVVMVVLAVIALLVWASAFVIGDPTERAALQRVGAQADFGAGRMTVLPPQPVPISAVRPITDGDLGGYVRIRGSAMSPVRANSVIVRAADGRRFLVRFEPDPPDGARPAIGAGGSVDLQGYLQRVALAEYRAWVQDSIGHSLPRPRPHRKFGWVPNEEFIAIDTLYIKDYYISVRPQDLQD